MSHDRTSEVWKAVHGAQVPPQARLVLLALADCENAATGLCNPSLSYLEQKTGITTDRLGRWIRKLVEAELLSIIDSRTAVGVSRKYRVTATPQTVGINTDRSITKRSGSSSNTVGINTGNGRCLRRERSGLTPSKSGKNQEGTKKEPGRFSSNSSSSNPSIKTAPSEAYDPAALKELPDNILCLTFKRHYPGFAAVRSRAVTGLDSKKKLGPDDQAEIDQKNANHKCLIAELRRRGIDPDNLRPKK